MQIKVLGGGCPNCIKLAANAQAAADELGIEATITKVTEMEDIMMYDIISTPALVVDEEVKSSGRIPDVEEIKAFLS